MKEIDVLFAALNKKIPDLFRSFGRYIVYSDSLKGKAIYTPHSISIGKELFEEDIEMQMFILIHEGLHLKYSHDILLDDLIESSDPNWISKPRSPKRIAACEMAVDLMTNQIVRCYLGEEVPNTVHLPGKGAYEDLELVTDAFAFLHQSESAVHYARQIETNPKMLKDISGRTTSRLPEDKKATPGEDANLFPAADVDSIPVMWYKHHIKTKG